ncbi:MAG: phosphoribosylformylglycinamidine cyclo-ligase [Patescibacteria group bacterium]|jgi:phosphoribosylformylglycinamidine cyclo-ligase
MSLTYKDAGVNISEAARAKKLFAARVAATYENIEGVTVSKFGQFASLVRFKEFPDVASGYSMDGIGTKLMLAMRMDRLDVVGPCLVAHCVNDMLTAGIRTRVLLDYVATAGLNAETAAAIVGSIADGCKQHGIALVGGELAEMPSVYHEGEYDLVACVHGMVRADRVIDGSKVAPGDLVYALLSSGPHCNGYSLLRRVFANIVLNEHHDSLGTRTYAEALLEPSRCYAPIILPALDAGCDIHGMANVTGGGIPGNLERVIPDGCCAVLRQDVIEGRIPPIMRMTQEMGDVPWEDMIKTFNLGVGFLVVLPPGEAFALVKGSDYEAYPIGEIKEGTGPKIEFDGSWGSF